MRHPALQPLLLLPRQCRGRCSISPRPYRTSSTTRRPLSTSHPSSSFSFSSPASSSSSSSSSSPASSSFSAAAPSSASPPKSPSADSYTILGQTYPRNRLSNITPAILSRIPRKLHAVPSHPISIIRQIIHSHFSDYTALAPPTPVVTVHQNFDELGFPADHPGRSPTDSYYVNSAYMLQGHTSAHEVSTFREGHDRWLLTADVYRRDEIDASHYPVFHQMEGAHVFSPDELKRLPELNAKLAADLARCPLIIEDVPHLSAATNPAQPGHDPEVAAQMAQHLKNSLNSLIFRLFGSATENGEPLRVRWIEAFFPFTSPSFEVEVWWNGEWLELLGSGVIQQKTLDQAGQSHKSGWAFGLGLDRLAMVLFRIPDIRLFWSTDPRFLSQFSEGTISTFKPYSKYPAAIRDMSFWLPATPASHAGVGAQGGAATPAPTGHGPKEWHENDYCEIVRDVAGDLVESVTQIDAFTHPKSGRRSMCYRLNYRSMDRSLTAEEVNALQQEVERRVVDEMHLEIR